MDFMLYLMRSRCGVGFACQVASAFIYDEAHAPSDAQSVVSLGHLQGLEPRVAAAIKIMECHIDEPISAISVAAKMGISVRLLENLFHKTMKVSPGKYNRALRLSAARRMAVDTKLPVQEIALRTGFNSLSAFSRAFRAAHGQSPLQVRAQG